jgi:hypothetical protein
VKKIGLALVLILLILAGVASATDQTKKNLTYNNHGLIFSIPANWSVAKDEQIHGIQSDGTPINDTKIVLTDGGSAIRIDIVEFPQMSWLRGAIGEENIYYLEDTLGYIYCNQVLNQTRINGGGGTELTVHPDGSQYTYFRVSDQKVEWLILWTKPDYGNKFVGIHSIHNGGSAIKQLNIYNSNYSMPTSLYGILDSISTDKPLSKIKSAASKDLISKV